MKHPLCYLLLFLCLLGCQSESKLTLKERSLAAPACADCAKILVTVPKAIEDFKVAKTINIAIEEELISVLKFNEEDTITTAAQAAASFNNSYQQMVKEFGTFAAPWEATIIGKRNFESETLISLVIDSDTYTGGAHGYHSKVFLNFDKKTGKELEPYALFRDLEGFSALAEIEFRTAYEIPLDGDINATGFMFPNDNFSLPEALGFVNNGVQLHYNPYDVASYADGPLVLTIPFTKTNPYLKESYRVLD